MCSHPKQKTCVKHSRSNTDEILAYFQTFRTHKWEKKTTESRSFNNYSLVLNGPAWASLVAAQWWRIHLPMQETQVWSWVGKIPWRRKWQTHSSILAWEIPWIVEPGGLQSMGSQRVGHNLATEQQYQTGSSGILSSFPDSEIITTSLKGKTERCVGSLSSSLCNVTKSCLHSYPELSIPRRCAHNLDQFQRPEWHVETLVSCFSVCIRVLWTKEAKVHFPPKAPDIFSFLMMYIPFQL